MAHSLSLTLGSLTLPSRFLLSPLEGVSCHGFRSLCLRQGAGLVFTEMVRAKGIMKHNLATLDLIDTHGSIPPLTGLQLLVKSPGDLIKSLQILDELAGREEGRHLRNIQVLDLNFGCPSREVIQEGAGPALLKRRTKIREIFAAAGDWRKGGGGENIRIKACGAKIRLGMNKTEKNQKVYMDVAALANEHLDYLTVHGRHAAERSRDKADWGPIAEIRREFTNLKLIGNGDALTPQDALRMINETGVDGVMIARGAILNPWIFSSLSKADVEGSNILTHIPSLEQVIEAETEYFRLATAYKTKPKYIDFHKLNFQKLRLLASKGEAGGGINNSNILASFPKNEHLS